MNILIRPASSAPSTGVAPHPDVSKPHVGVTGSRKEQEQEDVTESTAWMDSLASLGFCNESSTTMMDASARSTASNSTNTGTAVGRSRRFHHSDKDFIFEDPHQLLQLNHKGEQPRQPQISPEEEQDGPLFKLRRLVREETDLVSLLLTDFQRKKQEPKGDSDKDDDTDDDADLLAKIDEQCQIYRSIASKLLVEHTLALTANGNGNANDNNKEDTTTNTTTLREQLEHAHTVIALYQEQARLLAPRLAALPDELLAMQRHADKDTVLMRTLLQNLQQRDDYIAKLKAMLERYQKQQHQNKQDQENLLKFQVQSLSNDLQQRNAHVEALEHELQQVKLQQQERPMSPPHGTTMRELYMHSRLLQQQVEELTKELHFYKHPPGSARKTKSDTGHSAEKLEQSRSECAALKQQVQALQVQLLKVAQQQHSPTAANVAPYKRKEEADEEEEEKTEIEAPTQERNHQEMELGVQDLQLPRTDSEEMMNSWVSYF